MLLNGAPGLGRAALAAAPDASTRLEVIRQQMEKGQALFLTGKYTEAAEIFETGFREHPYSAFLFNAAVCHEKDGRFELAVDALERYLDVDREAPDRDEVSERIARLRALLAEQAQQESGGEVESDGGAEAEGRPAPVESESTMKSLVVIETTPSAAPVQIYRLVDPAASAFVAGQANPGWRLVAERAAPVSLTLAVGRYHVVVEEFREFNRSEADIVVSPGHVHHFQANLSQGAFMAFLRVTGNVPGAYVYVDDDERRRPAWGRLPHGELIPPGKHRIVVEAPGFQKFTRTVELAASDRIEVAVKLVRVGYGVVRVDANVPEAWVTIDDRPLGLWKRGEPALEAELPAGVHRLTVSADGHKDLHTTFEVPKGQVLPLRAHMIPQYPRGTAWTQAAIAAALLGTGTYLGVQSNQLHDQLRADRDAGHLDPTDPRIDRGRWFSIGANAGFAIGGVFALLSTYNFVKDPYPDSTLQRGKRREFEERRAPAAVPSASRAIPWRTIATGVDFAQEAW